MTSRIGTILTMLLSGHVQWRVQPWKHSALVKQLSVCLTLYCAPELMFRFCAQNILHTGDMRWHPRMGKHPALAKQRVDQLFLDTTYASPKHTFPSQVGTTQTWQHCLRILNFMENSQSRQHSLALQGPSDKAWPKRKLRATIDSLQKQRMSRLAGMPSSFVSSYTVQSCFTSMEGNRDCTVSSTRPACQQPCAMLLCQITLRRFQDKCVCDHLTCSQR